MKTVLFLAFNRRGLIRSTKGYPALGRDEIAVKLTVEIPDSAFRSPVIAAEMTVPEERVIQPEIAVEIDLPDGAPS